MANNKKNNEDKISFFEKMKDKKYNAKVQLIGYGIFILIVIIYASIYSKNYNYDYANKIKTDDNSKETSKISENKSLLDTISNNYHYDLKLSITLLDGNKSEYSFSGDRYENLLSINYNNVLYYYKDN